MPAVTEAPARVSDAVRSVREGVLRLSLRELATGIVEGFREHNLLVEASAIAFRVLLASIPCALFVLGLVGFLGLDSAWRQDVAPDLRASVSPAAYRLIDDTVTQVLNQRQVFWITGGAAIAVWQMSSIVRAVRKILNRIYGAEEDRSTAEVFLASVGVGAAVGALVLGALVVVRIGPLAIDPVLGNGVLAGIVSVLLRWSVAIGLLLLAVGLLVRAGPDVERPIRWVSFGAVLVVSSWAVMTLAFGFYLTEIADYGSMFGNLATVFVLIEYLFLSSTVFVGGLLADWLVQRRSSGRRAG
jgi:membrane protein